MNKRPGNEHPDDDFRWGYPDMAQELPDSKRPLAVYPIPEKDYHRLYSDKCGCGVRVENENEIKIFIHGSVRN